MVNGGFEHGFSGWKPEGEVRMSQDVPLEGKASASIGPGKGSLSQKYIVPGLRIITYGATVRTSGKNVSARLRVQCFDTRHREVMSLVQAFDPKTTTRVEGASSGIYFKTHAYTSFIVVSIEKTTRHPGTVVVDKVELVDDHNGGVGPTPQCDLSEYMLPIWRGNTVYDETVLLTANDRSAPSGSVQFLPRRILSVKDSSLQRQFLEGRDFTRDGKKLTFVLDPSVPFLRRSDLPKGDYPWLSVAGKHIKVTYEHDDTWSGPTPIYVGSKMPHTMAKLTGKKPLTIIALGDSITLGINVSGFRREAPYMPTWAELFAGELKRIYGNDRIKLFNTGLGGMTAQWGADNAKSAVASLNPDLVIIAFGMNDFWSYDPSAFRKNVASIMATVRGKRPKAEFLLVSSIKFDPIYTTEVTYVGHLADYAKELKGLVGEGVQLLDMTEISDYLYKQKAPKDLLSDPMHPDDFLARWYAQGLVAMLDNR